MPRRKTYKILAKETDFFDLLVDELRLMNPQLAADYDMETLEISMKKKTKPQILDIDKAIENLKKHLLTYKSEVEMFQDEALVHKSQIARFLGITRPTLDKWIQEGFINEVKSKYLPRTYFYPPEEILQQLLQLKDQDNC